MNSLKRPPDYTQFSLDDFELVYAHLRSAIHGATSVVCHAQREPGRQRPGALYIEARILEPALDDLAAMIDYLRHARFATPAQSDRALVLVAKYELDFCDKAVVAVADLVKPRARTRPRIAA